MPPPAYSERLGAIFGLVFFSVAGALLADVSKGRNHKYLYNPLTVPPLVELTKAVISCGVWLRTNRESLKAFSISFMLFSVPAYAICQQLVYVFHRPGSRIEPVPNT